MVAISRGRLKAGPIARAERTVARSRSFRFGAARKMAQLFRIADDINNSHPVAIEFEEIALQTEPPDMIKTPVPPLILAKRYRVSAGNRLRISTKKRLIHSAP